MRLRTLLLYVWSAIYQIPLNQLNARTLHILKEYINNSIGVKDA